jgi:ABC-type polar amino acid transport system ATPase subunit
MASSKQDFERFTTWLHRPENQTPPDVRRLANLALAHFDELAHTSREYSQRSIHLVRRARRSLAQTPDAPPDILSEGHIRCLGLAILLAKSQSILCPLIVFDDAINAIDHDHRSGIREAIFESDHFAQTQLIVTCHSPEFIKDIQQQLDSRGSSVSRGKLFIAISSPAGD